MRGNDEMKREPYGQKTLHFHPLGASVRSGLLRGEVIFWIGSIYLRMLAGIVALVVELAGKICATGALVGHRHEDCELNILR